MKSQEDIFAEMEAKKDAKRKLVSKELDKTIANIEDIIKNLIGNGGGKEEGDFRSISNLNFQNLDVDVRDYFYKTFLRKMRNDLDRDLKVASHIINVNGDNYLIKIKLNKNYKEPEHELTPEEHEEWKRESLKIIEKKFKEFEDQGMNYITSHSDILDHPKAKELINTEFIPSQNKWQIRNSGQYKLVKSKKTEQQEVNNPEIVEEAKFEFDVKLNEMFYEGFEDDNLKKFLIGSHKISINENMTFIPIKINNKNNYQYVLFADNEIEDLSLFRIKSLRYVNDQSNLIKLLEYILPDGIRDKQNQYNKFLRSFTKELSKNSLSNEKLLNNVYNNLNDFYNDKRLLKQFKYFTNDKNIE